MKYPDELLKFWKENINLELEPSAIVIYFFLIHKWIENKKEDFILSDLKLSEELNLSVKTIRSNKKKLLDRKLITFELTNGYPCRYHFLDENFAYQQNVSMEKDFKKKIKQAPKPKPKTITRKHIKNEVLNSDHVEESKVPLINNVDIPTLKEFLAYGKSLKNYVPEAEPKLKDKYNYWVNNGWNNDYNRPIINWKTLLKSMMQFIIDKNYDKNDLINIPNIKNPKIPNNE